MKKCETENCPNEDSLFWTVCQECLDRIYQQEEDDKKNYIYKLQDQCKTTALEYPKPVYLVYFIDLDNDSVRKSEITQVGIFSNKEIALEVAQHVRSTNRGYCEDLHRVVVDEMYIDKSISLCWRDFIPTEVYSQ